MVFIRRKTEKIKKFRRHDTTRKEKEKKRFDVKLFGKWDSNIEVYDPSLKAYLNLDARFLPRSAGRLRRPFHKSKAHIIERLALHLMIPGHAGRKHRITSGPLAGNFYNALNAVEKALDIVGKKENSRLASKSAGAEGAEQTGALRTKGAEGAGRPNNANPIEILVRAIENSALTEEIISYQMGSIMAREAVVTSPQRRIDKTLRFFAQSAYRRSFNKKKHIEEALAEEILAAYAGSPDSMAIKEKERIEREASGAR